MWMIWYDLINMLYDIRTVDIIMLYTWYFGESFFVVFQFYMCHSFWKMLHDFGVCWRLCKMVKCQIPKMNNIENTW